MEKAYQSLERIDLKDIKSEKMLERIRDLKKRVLEINGDWREINTEIHLKSKTPYTPYIQTLWDKLDEIERQALFDYLKFEELWDIPSKEVEEWLRVASYLSWRRLDDAIQEELLESSEKEIKGWYYDLAEKKIGVKETKKELGGRGEFLSNGTFFIRRGKAFKLPHLVLNQKSNENDKDLDKEYIKVYENLNKGKHAIWQGKVTKQFEEFMDLIKKGREAFREGYELGHWANDSNRYGEEESNASTGYLIKYKGDYLLVNAEGNFVYEVLIADPEEQEGFIKDLIEHFEKEE